MRRKKIRPRAMELLLTPLLVERPAVYSGRWPGVARDVRDTNAGLSESAAHGSKAAPLGVLRTAAPRLTVSETVVLRSRERVAPQGSTAYSC